MDLLASDVINRFYTFMWPMLRISALFLAAPIFSVGAMSRRIRILLALVLTWFIHPMVDWPRIDPVSAGGMLEILNQIFIGLLMGLMLQVVVAAIVVAGQAISNAIGLSMANLIDPQLGNVPVLSQLLAIMGTLIFLGAGGHLLLIGTLLKSFTTLPVGTSLMNQDTWGQLLAWSSMIFAGGLLVSLPVLAAMLLINAGLGVVTRAAPMLNIFSVGFPALIAAGLLLCILGMQSMGLRIEWLWLRGLNQMAEMVGVR